MNTLNKELLSYKTPVYFGDDALQLFQSALKGRNRIFFLADFRTLRKCLPLIEHHLPEDIEYHTLVIQEGERFKNINTCTLLWKQLQQLNAARNNLFINVGGGVVCDTGAFVASAFKRGMPFINIPTSLMAMADAAIGGKAGVDLEGVKNQVGLFTSPEAIYIYPPFLETLDSRQVMNGMAEVIKHALVADAQLWRKLQDADGKPDNDILYRSIEIKTEIVSEDFYEKGKRRILNFGHTIGHALESYSLSHDRQPLLHGEAIAAGMICEALMSSSLCGLSSDSLSSIVKFISRHYPLYIFPEKAIPEIAGFAMQDKKNDSDSINFSLLEELGSCRFNIYCSAGEVSASLINYLKLKP